MRNGRRIFGGFALAAAMLTLQVQGAQAQALDMTGTWKLQVESQTGPAAPTLTLTQNGTSLTGHYSSEALGEHDVTGTVTGRHVRVDFSAVIEQLGEAPLTYEGDVSAEGVWSGSLAAEVQGQPFPIGSFTATKS